MDKFKELTGVDKPSKMFYRVGFNWFEASVSMDALDEFLGWVYDRHHDALFLVDMGNHLSAVIHLVREFYGEKRITDVSKWTKIIEENMVIYNSRMHDNPSYYAGRLPRKWN